MAKSICIMYLQAVCYGFEEIEGLTVVDLLRRAGAEVQMVSISRNYKEKDRMLAQHRSPGRRSV